MPNKRYTQEQVCQKAQEYLHDDSARYADAASEPTHGCPRPLFYDESQSPPDEELPALAPSTLWRWVSWLAGLTDLVHEAQKLIREKDAGVMAHRTTWQASPRKFRSPRRKQILEQAMQCLSVRQAFIRQFGPEKFPDFAIAWSWQ